MVKLLALVLAAASLVAGSREDWRLFGAGPALPPVYVEPREQGFVATTAAATKQFRGRLPKRERQRIARFDFREHALVAVLVQGLRGARVVVEDVQHEGDQLVVTLGYTPPLAGEAATLYRLFSVPAHDVVGVRSISVVQRSRVAVPPGSVESRRTTTPLAFGASCWSRGDRGFCSSMVPSQLRNDVPILQVEPSDLLTFRLAFAPKALGVSLYRGDVLSRAELEPTQSFEWRVPDAFAGRAYVHLSAVTRETTPWGFGQAGYVVGIERATP
jgi:hypothetical protein